MEQTEADFREIERAHELPPDEPYSSRRGYCRVCGEEWVEAHDEEIVVCPECGSTDVEEV